MHTSNSSCNTHALIHIHKCNKSLPTFFSVCVVNTYKFSSNLSRLNEKTNDFPARFSKDNHQYWTDKSHTESGPSGGKILSHRWHLTYWWSTSSAGRRRRRRKVPSRGCICAEDIQLGSRTLGGRFRAIHMELWRHSRLANSDTVKLIQSQMQIPDGNNQPINLKTN